MKILHAPTNIGGMPFTLAKAQRELGHDALSYIMVPSAPHYKADIQLNVRKRKRDFFQAIWNLFKFAFQFDIFQFYFGKSLTGYWLYDVPMLKFLGKKVFFYFCGSDIRDPKVLLNNFDFLDGETGLGEFVSGNRDKAKSIATKYADSIFVSTADLKEFLPQSIWLPQPIDLDSFDNLVKRHPPHTKDKGLITVAHAPTNRKIKGSDFVIQTIGDLKKEGYPIELDLIENMPYEKALERYEEADILVDQLIIGWYGQVAVEMMALRKPVVCYIRDDLLNFLTSPLPIINANIGNLKDVLRELTKNKDKWEEIGNKGREYVEKYHDSKKVAKVVLDIYQKTIDRKS